MFPVEAVARVLRPVHTFSDGATFSHFDFSSADSGRIAVSASGQATAADQVANVNVALTATSKIVPAKTATTTLALMNSFTSVGVFAGAPPNLDGTSRDATFRSPERVAVDGAGNLSVTDPSSSLLRKVSPAGVVTTLGFGSAPFYGPTGIALDGNFLYLADRHNHAIRKIDLLANTIVTVAGGEGSADGSAATARFNSPADVAVGADGSLYVADSGTIVSARLPPTAR